MRISYYPDTDSLYIDLSSKPSADSREVSDGEDMARSKSSISKARSYKEIGEFWDTHDLTDYWDQTAPVEFEVDIQSEAVYYRIEPKLSAKISRIAKKRGVPPETLLNLWLKEKLGEESAAK